MPDPRHSVLYPVQRYTAGYAFRIVSSSRLAAQLGASAAWNRLDPAPDAAYGGHPRSGFVFARITLH